MAFHKPPLECRVRRILLWIKRAIGVYSVLCPGYKEKSKRRIPFCVSVTLQICEIRLAVLIYLFNPGAPNPPRQDG